jgi:hypothetical protein
MFFLQMAARTRLPATPFHFRSESAAQFRRQTRGCIRGSSLAPRVFAALPSQRRVLRQSPGRALPIPFRTKSTEALASASRCARWTKRKTNSRTDSQKHVQSSTGKRLSHASEREFCAGNASALPKAISMHHFSGFDYRRPAQNLAIGEGYRSIGPMRRSEAANWSALYAEGFSSCRKSSLMAARTSSALLGFASLL